MTNPTAFANIPIQVVTPENTGGLAIAKSLLHEIHAMLQTLIDRGQSGVIDLRALPPIGIEGYQFLRDKLSAGEVSARIHGFGRSEIQESIYPGIWWITHFNQDDEIATELIEVCFVPEILKSQGDDVVMGWGKLGELLQEVSTKAEVA